MAIGTSALVVCGCENDLSRLELLAHAGLARPGFFSASFFWQVYYWPEESPKNWTSSGCELEYQLLIVEDGAEAKQAALSSSDDPPHGRFLFKSKAHNRSFLADQITKHGGSGDLAIAKCLVRKAGSGHKVAQIFFFFWKESKTQITFVKSRLVELEECICKLLALLRRDVDPNGRDQLAGCRVALDSHLNGLHEIYYFDAAKDPPLVPRVKVPSLRTRRLLQEIFQVLLEAAVCVARSFDAEADFFMIHGERTARRYSYPRHQLGSRLRPRSVRFSIPERSLLHACLLRGHEFCCDDIANGSDVASAEAFRNEPFVAPEHTSAKLVPVTIDGEVRCLIRFLWTGSRLFSKDIISAVEELSNLAQYAFRTYDSWMQKISISNSLAMFRLSPGFTGPNAVNHWLGRVMNVLQASNLYFRFVSTANDGQPVWGYGWRKKEHGNLEVVSPEDGTLTPRKSGFSAAVFQAARSPATEQIFVIDVVRGQKVGGELPRAAYMGRLYFSGSKPIGPNSHVMPDGWVHHFGEQDNFPFMDTPVALQERDIVGRVDFSQVVTAIRDPSGRQVIGVVWLRFGTLRHLYWWERAFLRTCTKFITDAFAGNLIHQVVRNYDHMVPQLLSTVTDSITTLSGEPSKYDSILAEFGPKVVPTKDKLWMSALEGLRSLQFKTEEVRILSEWPGQMSSRISQRWLEESIGHSWAIATGLRMAPEAISRSLVGPRLTTIYEGEFVVYYENASLVQREVPGFVPTVIVNILSNALKHGGKAPYALWVREEAGFFHIAIGNGGLRPEKEGLFRHIVSHSNPYNSGVGLSLVDSILRLRGSSWRLLLPSEIVSTIPECLERLRECPTIFEIKIASEITASTNPDPAHGSTEQRL